MISRGYALAWEAPDVINPIIESFLERHFANSRRERRAS